MAAIHRLSAEIYDDDFGLVALHSRIEDYALAYALNFHLGTGFRRRRKDLDVPGLITIPIFEWKDHLHERYWTFFTNYGMKEEQSLPDGLFKDEPSFNGFHLVPEHRDTDYFLKIEQDGLDGYQNIETERLVKSLQYIPQIRMAYPIETDKLKSKTNIIF